jgi:hypothetical protein
MNDARDLIDKTVLVKLESNEEFTFAGVPEEGPFFCKVAAVDEIGIWVENKNFVTVEIKDSRGRIVPKEKQKPKRHTVNVMFPWRSIKSVVVYTEAEGEDVAKQIMDEAGPNDARIGFVK